MRPPSKGPFLGKKILRFSAGKYFVEFEEIPMIGAEQSLSFVQIA